MRYPDLACGYRREPDDHSVAAVIERMADEVMKVIERAIVERETYRAPS